MVRPAGPRISSMICDARSRGSAFCSSRSVLSKLPTRLPALPMLSAKSTQSRSTTSARTAPSCAIAAEMSLISSSCIMPNSRAHWSSPSASIRIAAFCAPLRPRILLGLARHQPFSCTIQPRTMDRRLVRMLLDQIGEPADRRSAKLALDLGEVHHALVLQQRVGTDRGALRPRARAAPARPDAPGGRRPRGRAQGAGAGGVAAPCAVGPAWSAAAPSAAARAAAPARRPGRSAAVCARCTQVRMLQLATRTGRCVSARRPDRRRRSAC